MPRASSSLLVPLSLVALMLSWLAPALGRDLSQYENGGSLNLDIHQGKKVLKAVERLRSFVWTHWAERKRAVITTIGGGVDSGTAKIFYFIEQNDQGAWQLTIEEQRKLLPPAGWSEVKKIAVAFDIKRIEIAHNGWTERVEIPNNAKRQPSSYHLLLKNERGGVVEEF